MRGADGWKIQGCPHTGASLAQAAEGVLWATWFTAGEGQAGIYAVSSADGGETFASRILIAAGARHPEIGALPDGGLVVLYESEKDGQRTLQAQCRDPRTGTWEAPRQVAAGGSYPRWVTGGGETALAFTCPADDGSQVVIADGAMALKDGLAGLECTARPVEMIPSITLDHGSAPSRACRL